MIRKGDYVGEIIDYIKKNLKKGYTLESLKWALVGQGHSKIEVEKAISQVELDLARTAPILKSKPEITYEVVEPKNAIAEEKRPFWKKIFKFK
jgi:hypothetical protein